MKIILIELNLQCSTAIYQSVLTPILDYFLPSKVVTMWQTDSAVHKLKLRLFNKSIHFQANLTDFHPQCELHLIYCMR